MEYNLLMKMHGIIDEHIEKGEFNNRFLVIFGSNEPAERIMEYLSEKHIAVNGLIDNNKKKDGTTLNGLTVTLPQKLLGKYKENALVLIASKYYPEMVVQLSAMGYNEEKHILKVVEYSPFNAPLLTEEEFGKRLESVKKGEKIYKDLLKEYGEIHKVFVCPLSVLGDAYVGLSCMQEYMDKNNIKNYALVMIDSVCKKIAYLFGFENHVFSVTGDGMQNFLQYAVFSGMADGKILVLNHRRPYTCKIGEIGNYKNINFMDHFISGIYRLPENSRPQIPKAHRNDARSKEYVEELFTKNSLQKGKTVILFPYAKTAPKLNESFWICLAGQLAKRGYTVCTNSGGKGETAVPGTKELFFDIRYALETVEAAGTMIGLRSGLCDVVSTARAKKIILYPDRFYGPDSFLNFFSLNRMQLCDDAIEIIIKDGDSADWLIEQILE